MNGTSIIAKVTNAACGRNGIAAVNALAGSPRAPMAFLV